MPEDFLSSLNPPQQEAVVTLDGPLLVLAGAGTGKTRVITCRIAQMLRKGIAPEAIMGMTFTNKAAREMKERLASLVSPELASKVTLGTFHSICARILRREIQVLGYTSSFTIADDEDQMGLLRQAAAELGYSKEDVPHNAVASRISSYKNELIQPKRAKLIAESEFDIHAAQIYERYQQLLENQNSLDFDDLLFCVFRLWSEYPESLTRYQEQYQYLLVDEYQDTNHVQFRLIQMLAGGRANVCVVGDDDQSIYGWRGAVVENILDFPKVFKDTKLIRLEENYRSTNMILNAANHIISANKGRYSKELWSTRGEGEKLKIVRLDSAEEEADFVADTIQDIMERNAGTRYSDIAILYRSNYLSRQFEQSLRNAGIPYRLVGGQEFYQRKEVRDAAAYLKLLVNPRDDQSLLRILGVPPRGLGDKAFSILRNLQRAASLPLTELLADDAFLEKVSPAAASAARELSAQFKAFREELSEPGGLARKIEAYLDAVGYLHGLQRIYKDREESAKRQENVYEFISAIAQFERKASEPRTLLDFMESFALLDENDRTKDEETNADAVTLTTVHAAKGLEFPFVFVVGMEHNLFPHERALNEGSLEEERRLFYVAVTRAKDDLYLSHTSERIKHGKSNIQRPSQFLAELPK
ncbi:MAG: hypothetical protein A2X49_04905, partial [Lentisphaerae bacterium GWF2_52_8]